MLVTCVVLLVTSKYLRFFTRLQDLSTKAAELVEFELGQLRQLPPCQILVTDRFEDWKDRLAKTYRRMPQPLEFAEERDKRRGGSAVGPHGNGSSQLCHRLAEMYNVPALVVEELIEEFAGRESPLGMQIKEQPSS
eukprot:s1528_g3.t1